MPGAALVADTDKSVEVTATIIDVTGNHRAWREMLALRLSPHADAEIRELAEEILTTLLPEGSYEIVARG